MIADNHQDRRFGLTLVIHHHGPGCFQTNHHQIGWRCPLNASTAQGYLLWAIDGVVGNDQAGLAEAGGRRRKTNVNGAILGLAQIEAGAVVINDEVAGIGPGEHDATDEQVGRAKI